MLEFDGFKERLTSKGLRVLETAVEESKRRQHYYLGVEHIFISFAIVEEGFFRDVMSDLNLPAKVFRNFGLDPDYVMRRITSRVRNKEEIEEELKKKYDLPPNLKHFAVNLNKLAHYDKLPPIIGRDNEIEQVMEILCHV